MSTALFGSSVTRAVLCLAVAATTAAAQDSTAQQTVDRGPSALARRSAGSVTVIQSRPQGAFGQHVGLGTASMGRTSTGSMTPASGAFA